MEGEGGTKDSFFTNADGKKIFCRYWCEDVKKPRALVFICHGVGEHCLWYNPLAALLKEAGFYVFAHDHVGHGQSEGDRVHVQDFHEYIRDAFQHWEKVAQQFPGVPKFLVGHSMGGAISVVCAIERPDYFDGVVLIAPAVIADPETVSPCKIFFGKILAQIIPQAPVLFLKPENISRDPATVLRYKEDPLVHHGGLKARWGASFLKWLQFIEANCNVITCPMIALHGTADKLTHPSGSKLLVDKVSSKDKTLKLYEGYYHQLHNEPGEDGACVQKEIVDWISTRIGKNNPPQGQGTPID